MENFSVPLLADSATSNYNNNNNNITNINHNHINSNTNNNNMHHHKDHMLAAGSTPSTTSFMYDTPADNCCKAEMSMAKSDYSTFTTCIQQSALLDHRSSIDANLDAGVSLGALCDLKFSGGTPSMMGASLVNETNTNFKGLPTLMSSIETNQIMSGLQKLNTTTANLNAPTFSNILFAREATQNHTTNNNATTNATHYLTLKGNEVQNTAVTIQPQQQQQHQQQHHYLPNTRAVTSRQMSPPNEIINRAATSDSHNLLDYGMTSSSSVATTTMQHNLNTNTQIPHNGLESRMAANLNENHITTTTAIKTTANETHNNTANINNSHHTTQQQQQQQTAATSRPTTTTSSTLHSIEEFAANSCTTPSSSTTAALNTIVNSGNNIMNNNTSSATTSTTTATTVPLIASNNSNNETTTKNQQQQQQHHSNTHLQEVKNSANNQQHQQQATHMQQHQQQQQHQTHLQLQPQHHNQQQHQHHQQHLHNSSTLSSDSNDTNSSSDEYIDMELNERSGYQDTTSSHSQQSANGGNAGGNGPSSNQTTSNPTGGVSLINGVVTLNSAQNSALTGGSNNGGSSASSASGTYMSLLPPNVGATSSPSGHLGGVNALGGGTSASASVSTPDVIDFKHLFEELCPVCGDKVSGYHYGLLTCESCKGFFKRTVQNKKVYTCVAERSCHIDKTQRKRCPYCRFQKCLEVGMKLEAVRADRMRGGRNKFGPMYKRDRARKLQVMRQRQIALQALRTSMGTGEIKTTPLSPGYQQAYTNMNIKQEIQIPQVSSLTQSPDSSPSPIAIALGQVNASSGVIATPMNGSSGAGGGGGGGVGGGGGGGGGGNSGNNNSSNTSDCINRLGSGSGGGSGNCHETGTGSLQTASETKLCFDSGTHPSSTADSIIEPLRVSPMIREFVQSIDDREWQTQLFALLQKQTYNQVEVDLFELMCKVLDQNLFSQVDWARNTVFFKDLKVDDQMKLLQHSWSDMLVLDHLHQRIHNGLPDETQLNNGQFFNLLSLGLLGVPQLTDYFNELQSKLQDLKFDMGDYVCMKFLILLNPDVRGIINKKTVLQGHENVQAALLDYTLTCYPSVTDKFRRLLSILPDIHAMAARGEEHLYSKHCAGSAPTQTLLMEMLHAKRKV